MEAKSIFGLRPILAAIAIAAASLALTAASASALSKHVFSTSFGTAASTPSNPYPIAAPTDVAVDQQSGDVYVTDPARHRIEKFDSSGHFILMIGSGVDATTGADLCTAESGDECQAGAPGTTAGSFTDPTYIALDNSGLPEQQGDLYVGDSVAGPSATNVQKYDPQGNLITSWASGGRLDGSASPDGQNFSTNQGLGLTAIAVDPAGRLFVGTGFGTERIFEFAPDAAFIADPKPTLTTESPEPAASLAVDSADNLYDIPGKTGQTRNSVFKLAPPARFLGEVVTGGTLSSEFTRLALDPATRDLYLTLATGKVEQFPASCEFAPSPCSPSDTFGTGALSGPGGVAIDDSTGTVYVADTKHNRVAVFAPQPYLPDASATAAPDTASSESLAGTADPAGAGGVTSCRFEYAPSSAFDARQTLTITGATGGSFHLSAVGNGTPGAIPYNATAAQVQAALAVTLIGTGNIAVSGPPGGPYTFAFQNQLAQRYVPPITVNSGGLTPPGATATVATVRQGGNGWPSATAVACEPPTPFTAPTPTQVQKQLAGLNYGTAYHYRLHLENAAGANSSYEQTFTTFPLAPQVGAESISEVHADTATVHVQIDPNGGESAYHTSYRVEYLTADQLRRNQEEGEEEFAHASQGPSLDAGSAREPQSLLAPLTGLPTGTILRYRVAAANECELGVQCTATGAPHTFATLPFLREPTEACPNAHVRQQTSSALLLDCRAYELASAPDTAGYDVESNLIPGQIPFGSYPQAQGRLLYGVHDGGIPGAGQPTNRGVDPYLAVRGEAGWSTEYVGIPANGTPSTGPFGSPLLEADAHLTTFAFGGSGLCSPCFSSGIETGIPLHPPGGGLTQGMAGPEEPASTAKPDGYIAHYLSADGEHLIFGSTSRFAPGGNSGGDVSIYDRNLKTGETHVVSNTEGTEDFPVPLPCIQGEGNCNAENHDSNGISELAVSADGSRILLGQKVSEDADHNVYWHLYMEVNDSIRSIDLTPGVIAKPGGTGFTEGVLYDGISADGSKVYFTTRDKLLPAEDTDSSADVYVAEVSGSSATLHLISTGEAGSSNSDACNPVSNENGPHWNALGSEAGCGALAIGGGGGVAAESGDLYFLSPEQLEAGHGTLNQPNLYLAAPGSPPRFVATLEPDNPLVLDAVSEAGIRRTDDFQVTPSGQYAAFPSTLELLLEAETAGHAQVYRYDASTEALACASCTPTGEPSSAAASLAQNGLSLTDAGAVFFTTPARLAAADTDGVSDVYEWEPRGTGNCQETSTSFSPRTGDCLALLSAGTGTVDSGLLGVGADGKDAFFFTRDSLVPQDKNGPTMKIYDAREGGGFPYVPPREGCKASDECHGPASLSPPPIEAGTETGSPHNYQAEPKPKPCRKGLLHRHGHCVKPHLHKHKHHERGGRG